jgi:aminoglycoside 6'-N-acetyltransferase I
MTTLSDLAQFSVSEIAESSNGALLRGRFSHLRSVREGRSWLYVGIDASLIGDLTDLDASTGHATFVAPFWKPTSAVQPGVVVPWVDGYWQAYQIAMIIDPSSHWQRTRFESRPAQYYQLGDVRGWGPVGQSLPDGAVATHVDPIGWDHEHCEIWGEKIGVDGETFGYIDSGSTGCAKSVLLSTPLSETSLSCLPPNQPLQPTSGGGYTYFKEPWTPLAAERPGVSRTTNKDNNVAFETKILESGDQAVLNNVAPEVFDNVLDPRLVAEFLGDERHHLAVAVDRGQVIGFASGVHYVHPDKLPELWINEVGVAPSHQARGVGKAVVQTLLQHARGLGCGEAWVLTDRSNRAAMRLYASTGGQEAPNDQVMFTFYLNPKNGNSRNAG